MYGLMLWAWSVPLRWDVAALAWVPDRWAYGVATIPASALEAASATPEAFLEGVAESVVVGDWRNLRALVEVVDGRQE